MSLPVSAAKKVPGRRSRTGSRLSDGEHKLSVKFLNDFQTRQIPDPEKRDRNLAVDKIDVEGPLTCCQRGTRLVQWLLDGKPAGRPEVEAQRRRFSNRRRQWQS